ncbi:MAG: hypothetical protein AUI10_02655 [Actinobacteria bacterium 13_2_20CM_2_72_6]|nr:MAG: hypothetical protein AUI10_02655 [Actinobacteria bacterium 13_2_20CM_2_72_6]
MCTILAAATALALGGAGAAHAVAPPAEFGTSWDNPRTAAPPVSKPPTRSCTEQIVDHGFADFNNFISTYTPPAGCPGPWAKVVLHLDGAVKGRQFDRLGWLTVGDVMLLKTSTPEPSPDGITWSAHPAPPAASDVLPLSAPATSGADLTGTVTVPRNTERLLAEVYATGSGGGCEEFWYITAPSSTGYSCPADPGPYREVQVLLDGQLAGIAEPFPHVYTGGWSNPFLWYVLPAPRAFDIRPITYDLSPYLGPLTDGAAHHVSVHVVGVPAGQPGWDTPVSFLAWRDPGAAQVTGRVLTHRVGDLIDQSTAQVSGTDHIVTTHAAHALTAAGLLHTSHGIVTTLVDQRVGNDSVHRWGAGENPDALAATWTDDATSLVVGGGPHVGLTRSALRYHLDGTITVDAANRLTTTITMTDAGTTSTGGSFTRLSDDLGAETP